MPLQQSGCEEQATQQNNGQPANDNTAIPCPADELQHIAEISTEQTCLPECITSLESEAGGVIDDYGAVPENVDQSRSDLEGADLDGQTVQLNTKGRRE